MLAFYTIANLAASGQGGRELRVAVGGQSVRNQRMIRSDCPCHWPYDPTRYDWIVFDMVVGLVVMNGWFIVSSFAPPRSSSPPDQPSPLLPIYPNQTVPLIVFGSKRPGSSLFQRGVYIQVGSFPRDLRHGPNGGRRWNFKTSSTKRSIRPLLPDRFVSVEG